MQAHRRTGAIAIFAMVAFGVACKAPAPPRTRDLGRVEVAFAGCYEVTADVCALDEQRQMHFWVEGSHANLQVWTNQGPLVAATSQVHEGQTMDVVLPANARFVAVGNDVAVWREIHVQDYVRDAFIDKVGADLIADRARARARLVQTLPAMDATRRPRIESLLARAAMQNGDYHQARASLVSSVAAFKSQGRTSRELKDALALAFLSTTRLSDVSFALALLERYKPQLQHAPVFKAEHAYQQGLAESFVGNVRGALSAFRLAKLWAERLRNDDVLSATQQWLAMTLMSLGRPNEALALQRNLLTRVASQSPCERGPVLATASWIALAQDPVDTETTSLWLQEADRALEACNDPFALRSAALNEVTFAIQEQNFAKASTRLRELTSATTGVTTQLSIFENELAGRILLGQGKAKAAAAVFEEAAALAGLAGFDDDQLRMLVAKGTALLQAGRIRLAAKMFQDAELRLDQRMQFVPIGEGRTRFLAARDEGAQGLVLALLLSGSDHAAFGAARRSRSRALQSATVGERVSKLAGHEREGWLAALRDFADLRAKLEKASADDWRWSHEQLSRVAKDRQRLKDLAQVHLDRAFAILTRAASQPERRRPWIEAPPEAGELILLYSRRGRPAAKETLQSWDAFASTIAGVRHAVVASPDASATKHETHPWLLPFVKEIGAATRVRVLPTNNLSEEIHALAFHDRPLLMHAPVVYSLDVEPAAAADGRPLIVADPTGDLPLAKSEGRAVADSLSARTPTRLEGAAAERSLVLELLSHTNWFHYAGHSVFAGVEGLDSGLPLAQGQRLSAADVLGLPASPALVVLSACEAGRSSGDSNTAGLGLAQAFVLAGSRAVVAPTRPVQDTASGQLMERMYQHLRSGLPAEKALQAAQLDPKLPHQSDWSAFRVLVP